MGLSFYPLEHKSELPLGSWQTHNAHKYQINFPLSIYHTTFDLEVSLPEVSGYFISLHIFVPQGQYII